MNPYNSTVVLKYKKYGKLGIELGALIKFFLLYYSYVIYMNKKNNFLT